MNEWVHIYWPTLVLLLCDLYFDALFLLNSRIVGYLAPFLDFGAWGRSAILLTLWFVFYLPYSASHPSKPSDKITCVTVFMVLTVYFPESFLVSCFNARCIFLMQELYLMQGHFQASCSCVGELDFAWEGIWMSFKLFYLVCYLFYLCRMK